MIARRSVRRLAIALAAFTALAGTGARAARAGSITGAFVEPPARTPLAAVEVAARRAADSTVVAHAATDAAGRFRLADLAPGLYLLRASLLGHVSFVRSDVELTERAPDLDLGTQPLAVAPLAVPGVTTTTERPTVVIAPDRTLYLAKDQPAATASNVIDYLRTVAELDVDIDGHVSLRGAGGVKFQINGRDAPLTGDALTNWLRQMPANRLERVEVIAHPSAKFDPEGSGGIVNLVLKDKTSLGWSGSVTATASNYWNGPGARIAWQGGPVTIFGGGSGGIGNGRYESSSLRQDWLASPPSALSTVSNQSNRNGYGAGDLSVDWAMSKRTTLYGTANDYGYASEIDGLSHVALTDATPATLSRFDTRWQTGSDGASPSFTLGVQNVVEAGRNERSLELLRSNSDNGYHTDATQTVIVPPGGIDPVSHLSDASGYAMRSLQLDDTHPLGAKGKLEAGARAVERVSTDSDALRWLVGDSALVAAAGSARDYQHRERFLSVYVTAGSTFGHLSAQFGLRPEWARVAFDVRTSGARFEHDYRSLYPSANVAYDFGHGRSLRLTYSKRVERPAAFYLDPGAPTTDTLNRSVGNPYLGPRYTHAISLDASWTGPRGLLKLSPYFRETVDNWDRVTHVDTAGVAFYTWQNASSVRWWGASLIGSLRQVGRLGGTLSVNVYREQHDASNLGAQYRHDVTAWSANANAMFKVTKRLDLQGYLRYSPAQTLAQGTNSAFTYSMLGARFKLHGDALVLSGSFRDPFNLAHYSSSTGDATYTQTNTSHSSVRGGWFTLTWVWGKPPQQKERKQSAEQPQQPDGGTPQR